MTRTLGDAVRVRLSKWGDRPHWAYDAVWLGEDEHGEWLGFPAGTSFTRPGASFVGQWDHIGLAPASVDGVAPWHLATFYATQGPAWDRLGGAGVQVYVDIATPWAWDGSTLRAVDLDLDVIRGFDGQVIVDDEDEFAEHQVAYGYPPEVVAAARDSCDRVLTALGAGHPPYDGSHCRWHDLLVSLATD